jgi:Domain of unknown function (DUF4440)
MKSGVLLLLICPLAYAAPCPASQAKDGAALVQIEQTWAQALEKHDADSLGCILASEFEDVDPDGKVTNREATLSKAASRPATHHELSELRAHVLGEVGYIRGLATAVNPQTKMETKVRFTDIYVYREGRWQCVAGQESMVSAMSH